MSEKDKAQKIKTDIAKTYMEMEKFDEANQEKKIEELKKEIDVLLSELEKVQDALFSAEEVKKIRHMQQFIVPTKKEKYEIYERVPPKIELNKTWSDKMMLLFPWMITFVLAITVLFLII